MAKKLRPSGSLLSRQGEDLTMSEAIIIDRWPDGLGWIAQPDELLRRASHAISGDEGVWLIDPLDTPTLGRILDPLGNVSGVVLTIDRHRRDAGDLAARHDVAIHLPQPISHVVEDVRAPTASIEAFSADTGFAVNRTVDLPGWREVALSDGETLLVGDALGTAPYFSPPGERLSVHPLLRLWPPRRGFAGFAPERVLVGHGAGIMSAGSTAVETALGDARSGTPRAWLNSLRAIANSRG